MMIEVLDRGRVRIKIRIRIRVRFRGWGLRLALGFTAGAIVAGANVKNS